MKDMNLGDGLKFEIQDGKPKLILSNYGLEHKNSKKINYRARTQKVPLKSKQVAEELGTEKAQRAPVKRTGPKTTASEAEVVELESREGLKVPGKAGVGTVKENPKTGRIHTTAAVKTQTNKRTEGPRQPISGPRKVSAETLRESLVCLTQEQLQQILSTISQASRSVPRDPSAHSQPPPGSGGETKEVTANSGDSKDETAGGLPQDSPRPSSHSTKSAGEENVPDPGKDDRVILHTSGLFSTLGERERGRDALEAKRAHWKKELDEQMALKKQQKDPSDPLTEYNPWGKLGAGAPAKPNAGSAQTRSEEERTVKTGTGLESTHTEPTAQSYSFSHPDLPAAIRSAFVLGEAAPLEHAFSAKKREQQRQWLQELDKQREEAKLRKIQEKSDKSQAEDHDRWAMHFDSLQKRIPLQLPLACETVNPEQLSPRSSTHPLSPLGAPSVACDSAIHLGEDSMGRASVDTTVGTTQKNSYLRTMTALLDPAQIDERERKKLKQLEHQRAIEAQVAERRQQRELEEQARRAEEQAEELRLARERERLHQQYENDELQQRRKEVREPQRQACDLFVLGSTSREIIPGSCCTREEAEAPEDINQENSTAESPRKDTAVQTDLEMLNMGLEAAPAADGGLLPQTPEIPTEYRHLHSAKKAKREPRVMGKENVYREQGDLYEAFARTGRRQGQSGPREERKPGWNSQKPSRPFVPASERYPHGLQQERQESRLRRQLELLTLAERNAPSRPAAGLPSPPPSQQPPQPAPRLHPPTHRKEEHLQRNLLKHTNPYADNRASSPPVPAVKHRLQQMHYRPVNPSQPVAQASPASTAALQDRRCTPAPPVPIERPPSSHFVPYVRTDEVYQLDPHAPLSRPPTRGLHHGEHPQPTAPSHDRDPLLHPELLKNRDRQQAILKGLSELRQGLLQKQRELESGFSPLLLHQEENPPLSFQ
nr:PREDICTED: coiled-coil domain-containing protein 66 [Lepisosteus oculatus]